MTASDRVIKRYTNRKLYDTQDSRYVTLDQISEMIRRGEDVKVVDNSSKEDLTSVTLAQIIFEEEKRKRSFLPLSVLRKMIQSSEESFHEIVSKIEESATLVGRVFRREESEPEDSSTPQQEIATSERAAAQDERGSAKGEPPRVLRDFIDSLQHTIDDWQKRVDANVHNALESMSPLAPLQKDVQALQDRIAELEGKLGSASRDPAQNGDTSEEADEKGS